MGIDRKKFFRVLGVTGTALALGDKISAAPATAEDEETEYNGILYDAFMCGGCQTCEYTCAEIHGLPIPEDVPEIGKIRKMDDWFLLGCSKPILSLLDGNRGNACSYFYRDLDLPLGNPPHACFA